MQGRKHQEPTRTLGAEQAGSAKSLGGEMGKIGGELRESCRDLGKPCTLKALKCGSKAGTAALAVTL